MLKELDENGLRTYGAFSYKEGMVCSSEHGQVDSHGLSAVILHQRKPRRCSFAGLTHVGARQLGHPKEFEVWAQVEPENDQTIVSLCTCTRL